MKDKKLFITSYPFFGYDSSKLEYIYSNLKVCKTHDYTNCKIMVGEKEISDDHKKMAAYIMFLVEESSKLDKKNNKNNYVSDLVLSLDNIIDSYMSRAVRPHPSDIYKILRISKKDSDKYPYFYDIIDLLMESKGYSGVSGSIYDIKKIKIKNHNLSPLVNDILEMVDKNNAV